MYFYNLFQNSFISLDKDKKKLWHSKFNNKHLITEYYMYIFKYLLLIYIHRIYDNDVIYLNIHFIEMITFIYRLYNIIIYLVYL